MIATKHYQDALTIQDAPNLQALVASFAKVTPLLKEDCDDSALRVLDYIMQGWVCELPYIRKKARGTDEINRHPICQMYATMIGVLTGAVKVDENHPRIKLELSINPIPRLWAEQFLFLSGMGIGEMDTYHAATEKAEKVVQEQALANKWFARLEPLLGEMALPLRDGGTRICHVDEFMYMHEDGASNTGYFKHRDTKNYVHVHLKKDGSGYELCVPKPYGQSWFDQTSIPAGWDHV